MCVCHGLHVLMKDPLHYTEFDGIHDKAQEKKSDN